MFSSSTHLPTAWKITLTTICGNPLRDFIINGSAISKIRLGNLTSSTAYTVRVSGINSRGAGRESEFVAAQTRDKARMLIANVNTLQ